MIGITFVEKVVSAAVRSSENTKSHNLFTAKSTALNSCSRTHQQHWKVLSIISSFIIASQDKLYGVANHALIKGISYRHDKSFKLIIPKFIISISGRAVILAVSFSKALNCN